MKILIAGGTGFIGHELIQTLKRNHLLTVLGRDHHKLQKTYSAYANCITWDELSQLDANSFDAVINLCGHNIADKRWMPAIKQLIIDSRVHSNQQLLNWIISQHAKPRVLCANAVGIYGLQKNGDSHAFTEDSPIDLEHPKDFMSEIGIRWQTSLNPGLDYSLSITTLRFGVVLKKGNGMLKKLVPSFYCGLGAVIGDGNQILSWIHSDDLIRAILFLLDHPELTGAFNLTAPQPIEQKKFAAALAKTFNRPLFLKLPTALVRLLFGEMGDCLLLQGQRVLPKRLMDEGFSFLYPSIGEALHHEFH